MNYDDKNVKFSGRLAKNIILDMIMKDIELYDIEELAFNKENKTRSYIFTKKEINYED